MARKNRMSVYDGVYHVTTRIAHRAMLFKDGLATRRLWRTRKARGDAKSCGQMVDCPRKWYNGWTAPEDYLSLTHWNQSHDFVGLATDGRAVLGV